MDFDLVEEACQQLYNFAIPLLQTSKRGLVHKSLQKAADILEEIESNFIQLRTLLHYESARCEIANDLLTKGSSELKKADNLDGTIHESKLGVLIGSGHGVDAMKVKPPPT